MGPDTVVFVGKTPSEPAAVVRATLSGANAKYDVLKASAGKDFDSALFAPPQPITLQVAGALLHVVFYPPTNPAYEGSTDEAERPPCVFSVHGGPTAIAAQGLDITKQFFTSRGWGWVRARFCRVDMQLIGRRQCDVNYGGSSGYGRNYWCAYLPSYSLALANQGAQRPPRGEMGNRRRSGRH